MTKYIVLENGVFKAIEADKEPLNLVLKEPIKILSKNSYVLVENKIIISWLDHYIWNGNYYLTVNYKDVKLLEVKNLQNIQIVIDALNRFKNISDEELEKIYQKALKEEKSDLEKEVEQLKEEKQKAIEDAKTYTEIVKKGKDLLSLIKGLEE